MDYLHDDEYRDLVASIQKSTDKLIQKEDEIITSIGRTSSGDQAEMVIFKIQNALFDAKRISDRIDRAISEADGDRVTTLGILKASILQISSRLDRMESTMQDAVTGLRMSSAMEAGRDASDRLLKFAAEVRGWRLEDEQ